MYAPCPWYDVSLSGDTLAYYSNSRVRVMKAGDKADEKTASAPPSRKSGWIDLKRIKMSIHPSAEWHQMFDTAWRLQKEHFWVEDMSGIDWDHVHNSTAPS